MQPRLIAITGTQPQAVHPILDGGLSIGRDSTNLLQVASRGVSRRHCRIEFVDGSHHLIDLDSRNGSFVNGVPVKNRILAHGDRIRLFDAEFLFLLGANDPSNHTPSGSRLRLPEFPDHLTELATVSTVIFRPQLDLATSDRFGRMARDLNALLQISQAINSIRDVERLQRELLRLIFEVIPADSGAVLLLAGGSPAEQAEDSICVWHRDGGEDFLPVESDIAQRAIWEKAPVVMVERPAAASPRNILCVPLIAVERIIGVIYLTSSGEERRFHDDQTSFLESVSRIAAVTLENILALDALRSENGRLKQQLDPVRILIGESHKITQVEQFIRRVARTDSTVLILGESGTGKEVVARSIHNSSPRRDRPFVAINCAAIPETLLESELFGSEKGAFTGANVQRKGKLEAAVDGTVFLDEIGELPVSMQAKLLRVLQQREFERVGGNVTLPLKARVLAATNKDLEAAIKSGEFRQDLYYRLNVVSVTIPPLRERSKDIPLLALYFAAKYAERFNRPFKGISREARAMLLDYDWPGNVRELENAIEHAIVLGLTDEILPEDLPTGIVEQQGTASGSTYNDALNEKKKELIRSSLAQSHGSVPEAARLLGLHPKYLHRLIRNLKLKPER
jgi:Nif-specific regulatory protein